MFRSHRLVWGLAIGLQLCFATRLLGQAVDVAVSPAAQTVNVGDPVSVELRLNTNTQSACQGGIFLQFDTGLLNFVNGANNTATWNLLPFNVEPAQNQPGIISLNVGAASAVDGDNVLVSTLNFTATSAGTSMLTLLFNAGREETQFFASDCVTPVTTNRTGGSVTIQVATLTPTNTPSSTPTLTPMNSPSATPTSTLLNTSTPTASPTLPPSATPTLTPTHTSSSTPTSTARNSPTPTDTPAPTATMPPACTGDCDANGSVTVDELITMVNIDLGTLPLSACPAGDADGSGTITVNEIIQAVGFALSSCPESQA